MYAHTISAQKAMVDSSDEAALDAALGSRLSFGTAGLRGEVRMSPKPPLYIFA